MSVYEPSESYDNVQVFGVCCYNQGRKMSLLEIEIVKSDDKFIKYEKELKSELSDDYSDAVDNAMDDCKYSAKCGEIFISNSGKFTFVCIFCDSRYSEMKLYAEHMQKDHLNTENHQEDPLIFGEHEEPENVVIKPEVVSMDDSDTIRRSARRLTSPRTDNSHVRTESDFMKEFRAFREKACEDNEDIISIDDDDMVPSPKGKNDVNSELYCEVCNRQFGTERGFERHKQWHISFADPEGHDPFAEQKDTRLNVLQCSFCSRQFRDKSRRISHERIHTGEKPFTCEHCDKRFRTKRLLGHHIMTHLGIKPHQCPYCEAAFTHKMNLVVHIRVHKGDKRYKCDYCEKRFIRNVDRRIHMRTHTGEKPYQCECCGNSFSTSSKLTEHRKRHTNTKPYKCEDCGKCFYSGNLLKNHSVVHSNARPFECHICFMSFPRKRALQSHVKIHSDVKEYVCSICGKAFAQNAGLYCHMKSHGVRVTKKLPTELEDGTQLLDIG